MAKKKEEEKATIEKVEPIVIPQATQDVDVTTLPTATETRDARKTAIQNQRDLIRAEREKSNDKNAANIDAARQNIKTLRQNAAKQIQANRSARQQDYANQAVDTAIQWMEDTGYKNEDGSYKDLDTETIANILPSKQLWYFQKFNNKGSNAGTALGGRAMFGEVDETTVSRINQMAKEKIAAREQEKNSQYDVKKDVVYGDGSIGVSNRMRDDMKQWGSQIADANDISQEQATQLYQKLEGYGIRVPKKEVVTKDANGADVTQEVYDIPEDGASIYELVENLGDDADVVMDELGFGGFGTPISVPHQKTYDEMMAEREAKQEELRLLAQQKELARQQTRTGLADLAAGFGEMIRGSQGAIVSPRDYQRMYDSLTAQQQTNFNNYLARIDALKAEQKAKQKLAEERAYQERLAAEQARASQDNLLQKHLYDIALEEKKQEGRLKLQEEKATAAMERLTKRLDAEQQENILKGNSLYFEGVNHQITPNNSLGVYGAIYGKILPYIINDAYYSDLLAGIEDPYAESSASKVRCAVASALNTASVQIPEEVKREIRQVLGVQQITPQGDGNIEDAAVAKKRYKRKSDGQIFEYTDAEWNGFGQVVKDLYEPIQ